MLRARIRPAKTHTSSSFLTSGQSQLFKFQSDKLSETDRDLKQKFTVRQGRYKLKNHGEHTPTLGVQVVLNTGKHHTVLLDDGC